MKTKSRGYLRCILSLMIIFSLVITDYSLVYSAYVGHGAGGGYASVHGGDSSKWERTRVGGGYLVSIVKYNLNKDKSSPNSDGAITSSSFDNAYKDSILVYNTKCKSAVEGKSVCINVGISNSSGKILGPGGSSISKARTVAAVRADTKKAKDLLGFKSEFGKYNGSKYNFRYETTLNGIYGEGGTRDLGKPVNRKKFFNAVEAIYGHGCTLGGVTRDEWLNNDAGDGCIYAILIVPICLIVDSTKASTVQVAACYPSAGVVDKTSLLDSSQINDTWGSYSDAGSALNKIKGKNSKNKFVFNGYVPYGMYIDVADDYNRVRIAANVSAFIDTSFYSGEGGQHEGVDDIVYSIVGASSVEGSLNTKALDDIFTHSIYGYSANLFRNVKYLYQDSWNRTSSTFSLLKKPRLFEKDGNRINNLSAGSVAGIKENSMTEEYKFVEGSYSIVDYIQNALYTDRSDQKQALNNIFDNFSSNVAFKYDSSHVTGDLGVGFYEKLSVANVSNGYPDGWFEDDSDEEVDTEDFEEPDDDGFTDDLDTGDDPDTFGDSEDDRVESSDDSEFTDSSTGTVSSVPTVVGESLVSNKSTVVGKSLASNKSTVVGESLASNNNSSNDGVFRDNVIYDSLAGALIDTLHSFKRFNARNRNTRLMRCTVSDKTKSEISSIYLGASLMRATDAKKILKSRTYDKDYIPKSDTVKQMGIGVQLYAKTPTVKSYLTTFDIEVDSNGNIVKAEKNKDYTSRKYTNLTQETIEYEFKEGENINVDNVFYIYTRNTDAYGHKNMNSSNVLSNVMANGSPADFDAWMNTIVRPYYVSDNNPEVEYYDLSDVINGTTKPYEIEPSVGTTYKKDYVLDGVEYSEAVDGFTIYAVRVYQVCDTPEEVDANSKRKLEDYELSHVYESLYSGKKVKTSNHMSAIQYSTIVCSGYRHYHVEQLWRNDYRRYVWLDTKKLEGEKSIASKFNNVGDWFTYVRLNSYDKNIIGAYSEDTLVRERNQLVDESMLITRDIGIGDSVLPSSISKQKNNTVDEFLKDVLKMTPSNKPAAIVKGCGTNITGLRNSNFLFTRAIDEFKFRGGWVSSPNPPTRTQAYKFRPQTCLVTYHIKEPVSRYTLIVGNKLSNEIDVNIEEDVYKYITDNIITGKNHDRILTSFKSNAPSSRTASVLAYRDYIIPFVKTNKEYNNSGSEESTNLSTKFYGEVEMIAEIPDKGDYYDRDEMDTYKVWMMSEKQREIENSSLYFVTLDSRGTNAISDAKLYSDNSTSNRNGSNGTPILYSGADVDLAVKLNIGVDVFGYSLDLINQGEVPKEIASYKKVVYDESDLVSAWGNESNKEKLKKSFKYFSKDVFNSIDADIILEEDGTTDKKYGNFSTSLGKYDESGVTANEIYQIVYKNGELVESNPSYQKMLRQLAKDYYNDSGRVADAKRLFISSGIYQTIQSAIEHGDSTFNKSQKHTPDDDSVKLGSDDHWYDEQIKTFVIRRFKNSAKFDSVTLNDKLDYSMGNIQNSGSNDNLQGSYNNSRCKWYLNLYYNKEIGRSSGYLNDMFSSNWYNPKSDNNSNAVSKGTVLVNELYIPDVDFRIASDTVAN